VRRDEGGWRREERRGEGGGRRHSQPAIQPSKQP